MSSRVWISALYVHAQRTMCHAIVGVNVVIGVLVVHCELYVFVRVVPLVVDAAIGLTLVLIALVVIVVFVAAIFHRILLYGRCTVYTFHRLNWCKFL